MRGVILNAFGGGHAQSSAKEMAQEKLSEAKEYEVILYYLQESAYKTECQLSDNQKRAVRRKAKSFAIKDGVLCYVEGQRLISKYSNRQPYHMRSDS